MADVLSTVSLISFIACGICLVLSVVFWFAFKMRTVIGDLSGRTARRSIERIRDENKKSGKKSFGPSEVNKNRVKVTDPIPGVQYGYPVTDSDPTETLSLGGTEETVDLTAKLNPTLPLGSAETTKLKAPSAPETTELKAPSAPETTELSEKKLTMLDEIIMIHTDEVIDID